MKLSESTIEKLKRELDSRGIRNKYLMREICDHIASDMEQMLDQGMKEEEAWTHAFKKTSGSEMEYTSKEYQGILSSRFFRMKFLLWLTFGIYAFSWLISSPVSLFAALLSFYSLGLTLIFLAVDFYRSRKNHAANVGNAIGSLMAGLLVMSGYTLFFLMILFQMNTRGHGMDLMIFSYLILSLVIFLYFIRQRMLSVSNEGKQTFTWFILFSGIQLLFAILSLLSLPFYAWAAHHIWMLIWSILAVNLVSLVLLLIRRIRNILFMLLLLLSFMITFIHSPLRRILPAGKPPISQTMNP